MYRFLILTAAFMTFACIHADRTHQKIYYDVDESDFAMCFRRFNLTHETGCSSARRGNVGVLQYVQNMDNVTWLIQNGTHAPYVVLLTPTLFNHEVVINLRDSGKVNGFLVIHANLTDLVLPESFSPDLSCPNQYTSMYAENTTYGHCTNVTWNPFGEGLAFEDFNMPIGILKNWTDIQFMIQECYEKYNAPIGDDLRSYPLCAAEVKNAMDGAKNTPTCIRRSNTITNLNPQQYCDPLGDQNVISFVEPLNKSEPLSNQSVIVLATKMDSFSMFENTDPAADSAIASFVTLLAAIEALGKVKARLREGVKEKPLMFAVFTGEAFDYIGSTRMLYEMEKNSFPSELSEDNGPALLRPEHIGSFIEIGQVGIPEENSLWLHTDPITNAKTDINDRTNAVIAALKAAGTSAGQAILEAPEVQPLPPASFQSFLKKYAIPGVILSDHKTQFQNKFYNSRFDSRDRIQVKYPAGLPANETYDYITDGAKHLTKAATVLARSLYTLTTGGTDYDDVTADELTMTHMLYCFLVDHQCELFNSSLDSTNAVYLRKNKGKDQRTFPTYVAVSSLTSSGKNWITMLVYNIMSRFIGDKVNNDCSSLKECEQKCSDLNKESDAKWFIFNWMQGPMNESSQQRAGLCYKSATNYSLARSPAFDIDGYDWESNEYSAWTESRWATSAMSIRVFLVPDHQYEVMVLCVGISLAVVFFLIVLCVSKKAENIFDMQPDS